MAAPRKKPKAPPARTLPRTERGTAKLSELKRAPYNPRRIDKAAKRALRNSVERFGLVQDIVVNRRTGNIVGGHQRYDTLLEMGEVETPVIWVDLSDPEEKALNITLNSTFVSGEFDNEMLGEILRELQAMPDLGFADLRLDDLLKDMPTVDIEPGEEDEPPPVDRERADSVVGRIYKLGDHVLICGDSRSKETLAQLCAVEPAQMVFTDPPYGVAVVGGSRAIPQAERLAAGGKTVENDDLDEEGLSALLADAFDAALIVCAPGASWYVAAPAPPGPYFVFCSVLRARKLWRQTIIWAKDAFVLSRSDYHYRHEPIFYGWVESEDGRHGVPRRDQDTVWDVPRPRRSAEHPTMKPVALVEKAISNSTDPGDIVLDLFGGSGTTLIAAAHQQRRARLVEIDPHYCDVIRRRWTRWARERNIDPGEGALEDVTA